MELSKVRFFSTATGSRRVFSLAVSDCSLSKLGLFSALDPDSLRVVDAASGEEVSPDSLAPGGLYEVIKGKDAVFETGWILLGREEEVRQRLGGPARVARLGVGGRDVLVGEKEEEWFCMDAVCFHFGGPLELGRMVELEEAHEAAIECPWHRYRIGVKTGRFASGAPGQPASHEQFQVVHAVRVTKEKMLEVQLAQNVDQIASSAYACRGLYKMTQK